MESAATGGAAHPPGACDPPQNCGGYMSLVGQWEEAKFPAGINLVQTMAPGWRQIVSEVALDLITIPVVSALRKTTVLKNKHSAMLSVKYVFLIWQETNGGIVILKTVLKSDL